jgi:hypothetical protein
VRTERIRNAAQGLKTAAVPFGTVTYFFYAHRPAFVNKSVTVPIFSIFSYFLVTVPIFLFSIFLIGDCPYFPFSVPIFRPYFPLIGDCPEWHCRLCSKDLHHFPFQ